MTSSRAESIEIVWGMDDAELSRALLEAVNKADIAEMERLVSLGASPNELDWNGHTILSAAVYVHFGDPVWDEIAGVLLPVGDARVRDKHKQSVLHLAMGVRNNRAGEPEKWLAAVQKLMSACDVEAVDYQGHSFMHVAAERLDSALLAQLSRIVPPNVAQIKNKEGLDPLDIAFKEENWPLADALSPLWPIERLQELMSRPRRYEAPMELPRVVARLEAIDLAAEVSAASAAENNEASKAKDGSGKSMRL